MNNENKNYLISDVEADELMLEEKKPSTSEVLYEDTSRRGKNTKHFRLRNGNFMAVTYDHPIHKLDPDTGKYVDVTSEVNETETDYETLTDRFKARLPKAVGKKRFVTLEKDGREISFRLVPKGASHRKNAVALFSQRPMPDPWEIGNRPSFTYAKADTYIDLQYDVSDDGVKESIILSRDPGYKIFSFELKLKGLAPALSEDGKTVSLLREGETPDTETPEMKIPPAFMQDANDAFCDDIHYELRTENGETFLDLVLDTDWLSDPERAFPVVIDPRVEISRFSGNNLKMVEVCSNGSTVSAENATAYRRVGIDDNGYVHRILIDFDLPELAEGFKITKAGLLLSQKAFASCESIDDYTIHAVSLNGSTPVSSLTWASVEALPISNNTIDVLSGFYRHASTAIEIDLTQTMRSWYTNTNTPHGIMIKKASEEPVYCDDGYCATYLDLYSLYGSYSYRPKLYVEYTNSDLYADHQEYHTFEVGRVGKGSVNLFNGSLLFAHDDIALQGAKLPLSISHLYRDGFSDPRCGIGWKLSVEQTVHIMERHGIHAVYTDAQGKRHYLMENSDGTITDDAGLGLTFSYECDYYHGQEVYYSISDEQGNKMFFDPDDRLIQIADAHGNVSFLTYDNGNLTEVKDGNGNTATLSYENGKLQKIIDADGDALIFTYDGDLLKTVTYPCASGDSRVSSFDYDGNRLIKVTDISGITYDIDYDTEGRVARLLCKGDVAIANGEAASSETLFGDEIIFDYRGSSTAVMNNRTKVKCVYKFDANGRVLSTYQDLTELTGSLERSETTVTEIFDYQSIMNIDETRKMGKYRSLSVSLNNDTSNETNLLQNGMFSGTTGALRPTGWSAIGAMSGASGISTDHYLNGQKSYYFGESNTNKNKYLTQTVSLCDCELSGNMLVASAWAKASAQLPASDGSGTAKFRLCLTVAYEDGTREEYFENYDTEYHGWQYAAIPFVLNADCCPIDVTVKLDFTSNSGDCYFTNARLVSAEGEITTNTYRTNAGYVTTVYVFDEEQNIKLISTKKDSLVTTASYQNENADVVYSVITDKNGQEFESFFGYDDRHNLVKQQDYRGIVSEMTYNSYGKETTRKTYHKDSPNAYFYSEYEYDEGTQVLTSERDPRYSYNGSALKKHYAHDAVRGLLTEETDLNGQTYRHTYDVKTDEMKMLASSDNGTTLQNEFSYKRGYLTEVGHNGFTYGFDFDALGRGTSVKIAGTALFQKSFDETNTAEIVATYYTGGEETTVKSDIFGSPVRRTYKGKNETSHAVISAAEYDAAGRLVLYVDYESGICYNYKYNDRGQVIEVKERDLSGTLLCTNTLTYDAKQRLAATTYGALGHTYCPIYEKNASRHEYPDNAVVGIKLDGKFTDKTQKDSLGRTLRRTLSVGSTYLLTESYRYLKTALANGKTIETAMLSGTYGQIGSTQTNSSYTYDICGNIETVTVDSVLVAKYRYDKWNRIVREDNYKFGKTYTWSYDVGGNITEKRTYSLCTGDTVSGAYTSDTYTYATSGWKDQLTAFNGEACTYDDLGNPTLYRGTTLTWTKVRRLAKFGDVEFTYNTDGLRTSKTANGITRSYLWDDSKLLGETLSTGSSIVYYYGADGIIGFRYGNIDYYYRKNIQGDVIGIFTSSGAKVASYVYDAWGNHKVFDANGNEVTSTSHIGYINPIRYRGYYFDVETGLYYVSSRYYDPEIRRWISPEPNVYTGAFDSGSGLIGYNVYAYCANNPATFSDPTGEFILTALIVGVIAGAAIGGAIGGTVAYNSAKSSGVKGSDLFWATVGGIGKGALIGAVAGGLVSATGSALAACKATSIAVTATVTATATITAKASEVVVLQAKKSIDDGDNGWQITNDCIDSVFNNGGKILSPALTKAGTTSATYVVTDIMKHKVVPLGFNTFLKSDGGKVLSYGAALLAWGFAIHAIFCSNPIAVANRRGYNLK